MEDKYMVEMLLRQVGKVHANKINQILDEYNMHRGQPLLLHLLDKDNGIPQSVIGKEMFIKPATVSVMVKRMEKNGLVMRKRDAIDERISNVYLTDAGIAMNAKLIDLKSNMEDLVFANFKEEEKLIMRTYLERVLENLSM